MLSPGDLVKSAELQIDFRTVEAKPEEWMWDGCGEGVGNVFFGGY